MTTLGDALRLQDELQQKSYGYTISEMSDKNRIEFIRWNVLALEDELHEALGETGWKPWQTSKHINREAFKGELVDALHFFLNLMLAGDITAEELLAGYLDKREKNAKRQEDGYDGVSTKCPKCKRALDDNAVLCSVDTVEDAAWDKPVQTAVIGGYCEREGDWKL